MNTKSPESELILASTSPYRKMLLQRLGLRFTCAVPNMDENTLPGESALELTHRLARGKAASIAEQNPEALVIGSDQVAEFADAILGKPVSKEVAIAQLLHFSGKTVQFHTTLCLLRLDPWFREEAAVPTWVHFREYSKDEAERYIELDNPLDCAGAFKSEAGGSMLLRGLESNDPTALIGLPLIALSQMLRSAGCLLP